MFVLNLLLSSRALDIGNKFAISKNGHKRSISLILTNYLPTGVFSQIVNKAKHILDPIAYPNTQECVNCMVVQASQANLTYVPQISPSKVHSIEFDRYEELKCLPDIWEIQFFNQNTPLNITKYDSLNTTHFPTSIEFTKAIVHFSKRSNIRDYILCIPQFNLYS